MILCGFVIYSVDFYEKPASRRRVKIKGLENFWSRRLLNNVITLIILILLRLINKNCAFEVDCEVEV